MHVFFSVCFSCISDRISFSIHVNLCQGESLRREECHFVESKIFIFKQLIIMIMIPNFMDIPVLLILARSADPFHLHFGHINVYVKTSLFKLKFLAHLSRRLTRWAYSIRMVCRLSSSVVIHTFKLEYLWSQLANLDQILCAASLGWGKGCIRVWGRLDQNSGFHGNRKPPLTYNGENEVSTFSRLFLIWSFLYLQVTRTCIKSRTSSNFDQIGPLTTELAALERLENFP